MQMRTYNPFAPQPHVSSPYWNSYRAYTEMCNWWANTLRIQGMNCFGLAGEFYIRTAFNVNLDKKRSGVSYKANATFVELLRQLSPEDRLEFKRRKWNEAVEAVESYDILKREEEG